MVKMSCINRGEELRKKLSRELAETSEQVGRNHISNDKMAAVAGEVKKMQSYFN